MSTISAGNTTTTAYVVTGDTTGNLTMSAISGIVDMSGVTGGLNIPVGTTSQRPASPVVGQVRYNNTISQTEIYTGSTWQTVYVSGTSNSYVVQYLVVAGGGAGGSGGPGGGGAGGMVEGYANVTSGTGYTVTVGAGGTFPRNNGANSVFGSFVTAVGGGYGGDNTVANGQTGGSGGGAQEATGTFSVPVANQGNGGGAYNGGGGGAGSAGMNGYGSGSNTAQGFGGAGRPSSISGQTVYYAGGGAGYARIGGSAAGTKGGQGGGGNTGSSGTANTGGGGGADGGSGGSGIVIVAYQGPQRGTGGTITSVGGNTIHTFTSSGTYTA